MLWAAYDVATSPDIVPSPKKVRTNGGVPTVFEGGRIEWIHLSAYDSLSTPTLPTCGETDWGLKLHARPANSGSTSTEVSWDTCLVASAASTSEACRRRGLHFRCYDVAAWDKCMTTFASPTP